MKKKKAGSGAALAVLLGVTGLVILIAVILVMLFEGTGIEHSPGGKRASAPTPAIASDQWGFGQRTS